MLTPSTSTPGFLQLYTPTKYKSWLVAQRPVHVGQTGLRPTSGPRELGTGTDSFKKKYCRGEMTVIPCSIAVF